MTAEFLVSSALIQFVVDIDTGVIDRERKNWYLIHEITASLEGQRTQRLGLAATELFIFKQDKPAAGIDSRP